MELKKLNDVYLYNSDLITPDGITRKKGIIEELRTSCGLEDYLTLLEVRGLDFEYCYNRSGEKWLTPLTLKLIELDKSGKIASDWLYYVIDVIMAKFKYKWQRVFSAFNLEYNPIENYNGTETETITGGMHSKTGVNVNSETETNSDNYNYGFNETGDITNPTPTSTQKGNAKNKANANDNYNETDGTNNQTRTLNKSGNLGVTTSQQMITSEFELRKQNLCEMIMADIDSVLVLSVY